MRKKIGKVLSALLASATLLSSSYIPVSATNPSSAVTGETDVNTTGKTAVGTADSSLSDTEQTSLNSLKLSSDSVAGTTDNTSLSSNTIENLEDGCDILSFDDLFDKQVYSILDAPEMNKIIADLPTTVAVTTMSGEEKSIPVESWDSTDYDKSQAGDYTFLPSFNNKYTYEHAGVLPFVNVCIKKAEISEFKTEFENEITSIQDAPELSVLESELPETLIAVCDNEEKEVPIKSWQTDYTNTEQGVYQFTPVIDENTYEVLTNLPYFTVTVEDDLATYADSTDAPTGKVTKIETFVAQVASGAKKMANGDYVWTPVSDIKNHTFAFRVNYSFSGQGTLNGDYDGQTSDVKMTIPRTILKDRGDARSDTYEMSIPERSELAELSTQEINELDGLAYYEDGNNIVVYNFKPLDAAQNGYFEVGYQTQDQTFSYIDYGATNSASSPFSATIEVSGLSKTTNELCVYINTGATVNSTYSYKPEQKFTWQDSWGTKPTDADDYVWQRWEVRTDISDDPTQPYDFTLTDEVTCDKAPIEVYGYKLAEINQITTKNKISNIVAKDGYRYDYVFTRIKKSDLTDVTSFTIHSKATATVHPVDGVDEDTVAVSTRDFSWTLPVFVHPTGHFYTWKYGNENWENLFGSLGRTAWDYASYDLDQLQEQKSNSIDNIKYALWAYGYPFPWTVKDGGSSDNWQDYGYKKVTYQLTDEALYNLNMDGTYGDEHLDFVPDYTNGWSSGQAADNEESELTPRLDSEDYDFSKISFHVYYNDVPRDENGNVSEEAGSITDNLEFNPNYKQLSDEDIIEVYTKTGTNDYVKAADIYIGTQSALVSKNALIDDFAFSADGWCTVRFKDGVDGFRLKTTNNYYYTDIKVYPYVSIKNTERILNWTGTGKITDEGSTAKDAVLLRNVSNLQVFDSDGDTILDLTKTSGDRLKRAEKASEISKKATALGNNKRKKECTISWKVTANETTTIGSGDTEESQYIPQDSGTFYDLLPPGANLQNESVAVSVPIDATNTKTQSRTRYLSANDYTVKTIDNFRNTGRTLLIVSVKESAAYYTLYYSTVHAWDSIADYGRDVTNPVAYETGNSEISGGFPDDPTAKNNDGLTFDEVQNTRSDSQLSAEHRELLKDLDADTDAYRFIYDEGQTEITALTSASAGLNKRVKASTDSAWLYDTTVHPDESYTYRLRFANTFISSAKDLILYDSLENYYKTDGAEKGESAWYGTLKYIDTSQMKQVKSSTLDGEEKDTTLNPVVYVSTVTGLDLDEEANKDLSDQSIWTKLTDSTDLSTVKAVAYDLRKDSAGNDFILKPGGSISSLIYMESPNAVSEAITGQYPETYNNVYLKDTVIGSDGSQTAYDIHYDYTTVRYIVTASFGVHKVSAKNPSETIKDISFRLYGTSDYGTIIDQIVATDKNGDISFSNIEKGTYVLQEYSATADWLEDHTEHQVVIDGNARVKIDGTDYTDKSITITNKPRIHGDISFLKESLIGNRTISGALFKLSGTSYYGNDVLMFATSDSWGNVTFNNVEQGEYELKEIEPAEGYIKRDITYTAKIDSNGIFSIDGVEPDLQGTYKILNEPYHSFMILKRSSYDNSPLGGVEFHLTGTSNYGTKVDVKITTESVLGSATFENLEAGTYILEESKGLDGFIKSDAKWTVTIEPSGNVSIPNLTTSASAPNTFVCVNTKIPDDEVVVLKKWVDDDQSNDHSDELPTLHLESIEDAE